MKNDSLNDEMDNSDNLLGKKAKSTNNNESSSSNSICF